MRRRICKGRRASGGGGGFGRDAPCDGAGRRLGRRRAATNVQVALCLLRFDRPRPRTRTMRKGRPPAPRGQRGLSRPLSRCRWPPAPPVNAGTLCVVDALCCQLRRAERRKRRARQPHKLGRTHYHAQEGQEGQEGGPGGRRRAPGPGGRLRPKRDGAMTRKWRTRRPGSRSRRTTLVEGRPSSRSSKQT